MTSGVALYQSDQQSKVMETQRLHQWECYIRIKDQFKTQQVLIELPVIRKHLRIVGENGMLFHFE
jgi:hypothetical protein